MAVNVVIISEKQFTVNGKTVYQQNGSWYANPYLSDPEETKAARDLITELKNGAVNMPTGEPQKLTHV